MLSFVSVANTMVLDQHQEFVFMNKFTKKSQWAKPTHPVYGAPPTLSSPPAVEASEKIGEAF